MIKTAKTKSHNKKFEVVLSKKNIQYLFVNGKYINMIKYFQQFDKNGLNFEFK